MEYFSLDEDPIVGGKTATMNTDMAIAANAQRAKWLVITGKRQDRNTAYRDKNKDCLNALAR